MKEILIDGNHIHNRKDLYRILRDQLASDHFTGNNLDALYDILTEQREPVQARIVNPQALREALGDYLDKLLRVLIDSAKIVGERDSDGR